MRRRALLALGLLTLQAAAAHAQEPEQVDRGALRDRLLREKAERRVPISRAFPDDTFPEDSLSAPPQDTLPRVDIEARRAALTEGGFPQRDSIFQALQKRTGVHVIEYRGREVHLGVREETLGLFGDAQVNRGQEVLTADTIRYTGPVRFMSARRNIELTGSDRTRVTSDSVLYYDVGALKGTVYRAETQFAQGGANWRVIGHVIPKAQDTVFATRSSFTSCEIEVPHYTFRAGRIKVVSRDVIVAWPVVLYVANVPVFWLPFFAQDIRPGRRSGILPPRFGINDVVQTSSGARRNVTDVGYYWAINDYMDAQATVDWFSGNYTRINGALRYRWMKSFIRGSLIYGQSFAESGRNLTLDWRHDQELSLNTTLRASLRYVGDTQIFQDQTFDPRQQTQTIDSDAGLRHRFSFADLSVSARRRQFLTGGRTESTLPSVNFTFSPVTLFSAPRSRQGLFNNMTLSGSGNFSRRTTSEDLAPDLATTDGGLSSGLRVRNLNVSGSARFSEAATTPVDSLGAELPTESRTTVSWNARADYQIDLVGSTALRPSVSVDGAQFRSQETGGDFVAAPSRYSFGASLSTDVYGFWPGFGPFTRIRHKFSPNATWAYAPAVTVDSALAAITGFPVRDGATRNTLSLTFRQTFEAKVRRAEPAVEQPRPVLDGERRGADTLAAGRPDQAALAQGMAEDTAAAPGPPIAADTAALPAQADTAAGPGAERRQRRRQDERIVTLLAINSSGLTFDFERASRGEPVLVTEELTNSISSDLMRGLTINMTHDLFEGSGTGRRFAPFLSRLAMSLRLRSGQGIGDLFGLGSGRPQPVRPTPTQQLDSRYRLQEVDDEERIDPFESPEGGPWDITLRYSLLRSREGEPGRDSQTIDGTLSFHPTPKWSVRWSSQYNFTEGEFGQHLITLDRDLHRWRASFQFARSPNGNVIFQVSVTLRDAPDIRGDYRQRTDPPRR